MTHDQHQPATGSPVWIDLSTSDLEGAHAFYGELFGWTFESLGEEYGNYEHVRAGEEIVGGMMSTSGMPSPEGGDLPTEWGVYLGTGDIAGASTRAEAAGARVAIPAMQVGEQGSMAVLIDPSGATVGLWQPGTFRGFSSGFCGRPGTPAWFELMTQDFDQALPFYRDVMGWDITWMGDPESSEWRYVTNGPEESATAGLGDAKGVFAADAPSAWRVYLAAHDVDADLERLRALGGEVLDGPVDSPYGRVATVRDPQGATFQFIQGRA